MAQLLDADPIYLLEELLCRRFKLLKNGNGLVKLCAGRKVFQTARQVAGGRRKFREHATTFVSRFSQARPIPAAQGLLQRGKMLWHARGKRTTHFFKQRRV